MELGIKTAWLTYTAVSLLSMLIIPDKETALMFIAFFGYYPFLKLKLDTIKLRLLRILIKLAIFNITIIAAYGVLIWVLGLSYLASELQGGFGILLIVMANVFFPIYELALRSIYLLYIYRIRKTLFKL